MIYLLIGIVCNALLFLILKYFDRLKVNTLQAIVVNYFVAGSLGLLLSPVAFSFSSFPSKAWAWVPPVLGSLFIGIFLLLARTAQQVSVSAASVANKMSVIIPVMLAVWLYGDSINAVKIAGIVLALGAVFFTSRKSEASSHAAASLLWLPVVVFIGSGIIDALVNYSQQRLVEKDEAALFVSCSFLFAFILGICSVIFRLAVKKEKFQAKALLGGLVLGLPNYFSLWGIVRALEDGLMESSMLYPVANMGIVVCSALGAFLLFREKLSRLNWLGIGLSLIAILLIAFADRIA